MYITDKVIHSGSSIYNQPTDLLAGILQHLDQQQRLQCCALVCRNWRQAAYTATCAVNVSRNTKRRLKSLSAWLISNRHVGSLQSIRVISRASTGFTATLQLPFPQLTALHSLQLPSCCLEAAQTNATAPAGASTAAAPSTETAATQLETLAALTALSRLKLENTKLSLSCLGSCTGLQHVELRNVRHVAAANSPSASAAAADDEQVYDLTWRQLATALPQLTQLTYRGIQHSIWDDVEWIGHALGLSALQQLQEISVGVSSPEAIDFRHLSPSLTSLHLYEPLNLDISSEHPLQQLTQLQRFHSAHACNAVLLFSLTNLTWLCVHDRHGDFGDEGDGEMLLEALQQLKQLRHLALANCLPEPDSDLDHLSDPAMYAALTASSHLTLLEISHCFMPEGTLEHFLPAADALSDLKILTLPRDPMRTTDSFGRLVACCPALEQLMVYLDCWPINPPATMDVGSLQGISTLSRLTALSKLTLEYFGLTNDSVQNIAACSQLKELRLTDFAGKHIPLTAGGMQHLCQLSGLTFLELNIRHVPHKLSKKELVSRSSPPDVHLQLQQLFARGLDRELFLNDDEYSDDYSDDYSGDCSDDTISSTDTDEEEDGLPCYAPTTTKATGCMTTQKSNLVVSSSDEDLDKDSDDEDSDVDGGDEDEGEDE